MKVWLGVALAGSVVALALACGASDDSSDPPIVADAGNEGGCLALADVPASFATFDDAWKTYFEATALLKCSGDEIDWSECGNVKTVSCGSADFSETHVYDTNGTLIGTERSAIAEFKCNGTGAGSIDKSTCTRHGFHLGNCASTLSARCADAGSSCPTDFTSAWTAWKASGSVGAAACSVLSSATCGSFSRIRCVTPTDSSSWDAVDWYFDPTSGAPLAERTLKVDEAGQELTIPNCAAGPTWIPEPTTACSAIDSVTFTSTTDAGTDAN